MHQPIEVLSFAEMLILIGIIIYRDELKKEMFVLIFSLNIIHA